MKIVLFALAVGLCCQVYAQEESFPEPLHEANEVISALYNQTRLKPSEVKIMIFEYDYIKGSWHIELAPANEPCIDCYPSYYFKNEQELVVESVMHG